MPQINGLDHVGIAVASLDKAVAFYRDVLGLQHLGTEEVPGQKTRIAMFRVGETAVELLESTARDGPVAKHIRKRGEGLHHIAFRVGDIETALRHCGESGIRLINREPVAGAHGSLVAFLHPASTGGVLVELCQPEGGI